jgi:hypothetical protein
MTVLSLLTACTPAAPAETTEPTVTEPPEEAKVLKVLTLGHSLSVNATRMLNLVAHAEGFQEMTVGTLYYSGCPLNKHVEFLTNNSPVYSLYTSSTETAGDPPAQIESVTMLDAIKSDYWDIIVMQGGTYDLAKPTTFTDGNIQAIQKYVNEHKRNPNAVFYWHLPWAFATDPELQNDRYMKGYEAYGNDRRKLFDAFSKNVQSYIIPDETFVKFIPSGAAVENAISSYMTEKDLLCDYAHATDFGRLIAAYTYFCVLTGVEKLEEIKLDAIPKKFVKTSDVPGDRVLTEDDKALILESVNNALANPLQITESQYKQAPEGYVPVLNHDG